MRLAPIALAPLALAATACAAPSAQPAPAPVFDPMTFFAGRLRGEATLSVLLRRDRPVAVESRGRVRPDGVLVLDQRIEEEGEPARTRRWLIRRTGPATYAGTLSDAAGPVSGRVRGNRLELRFAMRGGLRATQRLDLAPDGRSADNRLTVTKFGLPVARLRETIRKLD